MFNLNSPIVQSMFPGGVMPTPPVYNLPAGVPLSCPDEPMFGYGAFPTITHVSAPVENWTPTDVNGNTLINQTPANENNTGTFNPSLYVPGRMSQFNPVQNYNPGINPVMMNPYMQSNIMTGYGYNPYFNPYQSQQMYMQMVEMEENKRNASIMKRLSIISSEYIGKDVTPEQLEQFDPIDPRKIQDEIERERHPFKITVLGMRGDEIVIDSSKTPCRLTHADQIAITRNIAHINATAIPYNVPLMNTIQNNNARYDKYREKYPDSMGVIEFFSKAGGLYSEMLARRFNQNGGVVKSLYSPSKYKEMMTKDYGLRFNSNMDYFKQFSSDKEYTEYTGISYNPDLGSLEVTVPDRIRRSYDKSRNEFNSSISKNGESIFKNA